MSAFLVPRLNGHDVVVLAHGADVLVVEVHHHAVVQAVREHRLPHAGIVAAGGDHLRGEEEKRG